MKDAFAQLTKMIDAYIAEIIEPDRAHESYGYGACRFEYVHGYRFEANTIHFVIEVDEGRGGARWVTSESRTIGFEELQDWYDGREP